MKFLTSPELEKVLKSNPFHPGIISPRHPQPTMSGHIGRWLEACFPDSMRPSLSTPAPTDKPYLTSSINTDAAGIFYGMCEPAHRMLILATSEAAWGMLRFKRPSKINVFLRQGQPSSYVHVLSQESHGAPLINFVHINTPKDVKGTQAVVRNLIDYHRRPVFVLSHAENAKAVEAQHRSSIRTKIVLKNAVITVNDAMYTRIMLDDLPYDTPEALKKVLTPAEFASVQYQDYYIYLLGIGYSSMTFELNPLSPTELGNWIHAGTRINAELNSNLGSTYIQEHFKVYHKKFLEAQPFVPNMDHCPVPPKFKVDQNLRLNRKLKVKSPSGLTNAFLQLDNALLQAYNPTQGRHTGIIDCLLSRPNLLSKGASSIIPALKSLGYNLAITPELIRYLDKKKKFFARQSVPLNPVTNTELLAYFEPGKYICKETVYHEGTSNPVWIKGQGYDLVPGWTRDEHDAGSEAIVDEHGRVIGEDTYQLKISVLHIRISSEMGMLTIKENVCRESLAEEELETGKTVPWYPVLDEFIKGFDLPNVSHVGITHKTELEMYRTRLKARLPHLLPYQIEEIVKNVVKCGGILASTMGSGKTHMGMGTLFLKDKAFNLIVVPPALVSNWVKTLTEFKFFVQPLLTHESVDTLITHFNSLKGLPPSAKRAGMHASQEFYVTTPEFLALGDWGNKVYKPWVAKYRKKERAIEDPTHGKVIPTELIQVTSTRYHSSNEAKELNISLNQPHEYGHHVHECPKCKTSREEGFSFRGYCSSCGFSAYSYVGSTTRQLTLDSGVTTTSAEWIFGKLDGTVKSTTNTRVCTAVTKTPQAHIMRMLMPYGAKHDTESLDTEKITQDLTTELKTHSSLSYPAYKRLRKIFGAKLIDEVHEVANFDSQKGSAVKSVKSDTTWACSGTISRGHVKDIESAILHSYEANSPLCPYSDWDKTAFREQFVTQKVKKSTLFTTKISATGKKSLTSKTKSSVSIMPEASNVTLLRKILATKMTMVPPVLVEAEWKLPPVTRKYIPVKLSAANEKYYYEVLANIAEWYKHASSKDIRHNTMSKLWELRHICEGEDKLNIIKSYILAWAHAKEKFVIASPTKPMFIQIKAFCKEHKLNIIFVDESVPTHKREEVTSKFSDPDIIGIVARTKLVNTGLNTMVYANKLLIAGLEYFPSTLRQMEKRLARPGQKAKHIEIIYPIVRLTPKESVEEQMLRLIFRKESAVNEVLQGKIRWIKSAQLIETIMEKQGAGKVLESLLDKETSPISEFDLNAIFETEYQTTEAYKERLAAVEAAIKDDFFLEVAAVKPEVVEAVVSEVVEDAAVAPATITEVPATVITPVASEHTPGSILTTTNGQYIVTPKGGYLVYDPVLKKGKQGKPYKKLPFPVVP